MKAKLSLLTAACLFALAPAINAADDQAKSPDKKDAAKCEDGKCHCEKNAKDPVKKTVMLTGSNIPQTITQVGRITNGAQPVTVISAEDLANSGELNLAAALRKTVPGMH